MLTSLRICVTVLLMLAATTVARAQDSVKIGGFWIDNVSVQGFVEGQIVYIAPGGGEVNQPLERVEGLKLARYPALAQAQAAIEAGQLPDALKALATVRGAAKEPWIQRYVAKLQLESAEKAGKGAEAADAFVMLATTPNIDAYFITVAPLNSVAGADIKTQLAIKQKLAAASTKLPKQGPIADMAAQLTEVVKSAGEQPATPEATPGSPGSPATDAAQPPAPTTPAAPQSAVVLPSFIDEDAITKALRAGKFEEALASANAALLSSGDLSMKLYQHGMAKLGLADRTTDDDEAKKLYKDAGLSFMRVVIYFPASRYKGAALTEAGYVHHKIGRDDIARRLYQNADLLLGDPEESPAYFERLRQLNEALATQQ